jgi:hypothetical protein
VGRDPGDVDAQLAATLIIAAWSAALVEAQRTYHQKHDAQAAKDIFLGIVDRSARGLEATMRESPYM